MKTYLATNHSCDDMKEAIASYVESLTISKLAHAKNSASRLKLRVNY